MKPGQHPMNFLSADFLSAFTPRPNNPKQGSPATAKPAGGCMTGLSMGLMLAMWQSLSASSVPSLAALNPAWMRWNSPQQPSHNPDRPLNPALAHHAAGQVLHDIGDYLKGVALYQQTPPLPRDAYMVLWQQGSSALRVVSHPAPGKPALLLVPSLINRWWMMDIHPSRSFVKHLAAQGYGVAVMDWQEPGPAERHLSIDGYITQRLLPAMTALHQTWQRPLSLVGYCMGGLMAMAAAQLPGEAPVAKLLLLTTPWDFRTPESNPLMLEEGSIRVLESTIEREGCLPASMMQPIFYRTDIWRYARMFQALGKQSEHERAQDNTAVALAVQRWLHEAVPMSAPAARQCLVRWFAENQPMRGEWRINGYEITPAALPMPVMLVCPTEDKLVPPAASKPLETALPQAEVLRPRLGHIGLMSSRLAPQEAWAPMVRWLES